MDNLLSVNQARELILNAIKSVSDTTASLSHAFGRILFADVIAPFDLPLFNNSSMDGYAVKAADLENANSGKPIELNVVADIPAGTAPTIHLENGQAARIMTGAQVPVGADTVVPVENILQESINNPHDLPAYIRIPVKFPEGSYIRKKGMDIVKGRTALPRGKQLQAEDVGLIASFGLARVNVFRYPRVALLTTGSELISPSQKLVPGKIYDSNSYMIKNFIQQHGCEIIWSGIVPDDADILRNALHSLALQKVDLILTSAGVSVGEYDYVRSVIKQEGDLSFWRVNIRPGKPLMLGHYHEIPVIGLPGNPVSAFVTLKIMVSPALHKMAGRMHILPGENQAILQDVVFSDGRETYLRGSVKMENGQWHATLAGNQESSNLFALTQANALLILPNGVKSLPLGSAINFISLDKDLIEGF